MKKLLNPLCSASASLLIALLFSFSLHAENSDALHSPPIPGAFTSFSVSGYCTFSGSLGAVIPLVVVDATFEGVCVVNEVCYEDESGTVTCIDLIAAGVTFGSANGTYYLIGLDSDIEYTVWANTSEATSESVIYMTPPCDAEIPGCTDPEALNYDPEATWNTNACTYPEVGVNLTFMTDCWGGESSWSITSVTGATIASVSSGTYGNLQTYTWSGSLEGGCYELYVGDTFGDGLAGTEYFSCGVDGDFFLTTSEGLLLAQMGEANFGGGVSFTFCLEIADQPGCIDPEACNYDAANTSDDGSCTYPGCEDPNACNFIENPGCIDCDYESCDYVCPGDFNGDGFRGTEDLLIMLTLIGSSDPDALIADLDENAIVGAGDWLLFLGLFGTPCPE